jgi:hypothetical protein
VLIFIAASFLLYLIASFRSVLPATLPFELVSIIVVLFVGPFHDDPDGYEDRKVVASLVCRTWWSVVQMTHTLWAHALVDNYTEPARLVQGLERAGSLPFHLHIALVPRQLLPARGRSSLCHIEHFFESLSTHLAPYMDRCSCLTIDTQDTISTRALLCFLDPLLLLALQRFHLRVTHQISGTPVLLASRSHLQELTIMGSFLTLPQ